MYADVQSGWYFCGVEDRKAIEVSPKREDF